MPMNAESIRFPAPRNFSALRTTCGNLSLRVREGDIVKGGIFRGRLTAPAAANILQRTNFQTDIERETLAAMRQALCLPVLESVQLTSHRATDSVKLNWQAERGQTAEAIITVSDLVQTIEDDYAGFIVACIKVNFLDGLHIKLPGNLIGGLGHGAFNEPPEWRFKRLDAGELSPDFFPAASERFGEWCKSLDTDQIPE